MKEQKLNRVHIRDPRAAAIFTDPKLRRFLLWFIDRPRSIGEAARELDMDPKRTHYHVRRLVDLGLMRMARVEPRAGRPIRYYRAAGRAFFIPNEITADGFGETLARELREGLAREFSRSNGGMLFTAARNGSPRGRIVGGTGDAVEMWRVLRLSRDRAESLRREIAVLFNRYQADPDLRGGATYLVHAALAPRLGYGGVADNAE